MTWPLENRITSKMFASWLAAQVNSDAKVIPGRVPQTPNRVIGVQMQGGPGLVFEATYDVVTFQITCRGAENNLDDAERIALEVDNVILNAPANFEIGVDGNSVNCNDLGRTGGSPAQLPMSDPNSRWVFTCNYYGSFSTNVGMVN